VLFLVERSPTLVSRHAGGALRMLVTFLVKGVVVGLIIGVPVGPVGILCLRRTIFEGRLAGLAAGLGAASGDALFGAIAGFGLTAISNWLLGYQGWLRLAGACFLFYIGANALLREPQRGLERRSSEGLLRNSVSTFVLTIANPVTILALVAIIAGLGLAGDEATFGRAGMMVFGVWLGSLSWWLMLSLGAGMLRSSFDPRLLTWINRGSAGILLLSGAGLLATLVFRHVV
jgi:threonine/homoserine/homoserine lactone efflux protein